MNVSLALLLMLSLFLYQPTPGTGVIKEGRKLIDVPEGCPEGSGFSVTGEGCLEPFKLFLNKTKTNTKTNTKASTKASTHRPSTYRPRTFRPSTRH
ncbi:unnamed protein product [Phyllotreta striolata]|uniref:Uncharacterized protein n=1 Tax=Phyllotreta striolata TaxID=444603 RepID=A0A9N9TB84_PHYSR|nr:unnamed protein product [Phyllotreta striolata]